MTNEFLAAVGSVTVEFSVLERQLDIAIWSFAVGLKLEGQPLARLITAQLGYRQKVDLFAALVKQRYPNHDGEALKSLLGELQRVGGERNTVVHSAWALAPEGNVVQIKTSQHGALNTTVAIMSVEAIRSIRDSIHAAAERVLNFFLALVDPAFSPVTL